MSRYNRSTSSGIGYPPWTPAVKTLVIACVITWVVQLIAGDSFTLRFGLIPRDVTQHWHIWQLASYIFLHGDIMHILFNMLGLWMFGSSLEDVWGSRQFTKFFFICGIGAGILMVLLSPSDPRVTIGASGSIYGILLAFGMLFPDRIIYWLIFPIPAKYFVMIMGGIAFYSSMSASGGGIAHLAHLGGMLCGFVYLKSRGLTRRRAARRRDIQRWRPPRSICTVAAQPASEEIRRLLQRKARRRKMAALEKLERFRSYNRWLQERFGERVYKVIVDAGFTCPNRDGTVATGGCTYCNNSSFRPPSAIKTDPIRDQVREGIAYVRKRFHAKKFIVYFQPYSNTYAETEYLRQLYTDAIDHPEVVGLAIGTRADCVDAEKIRMIDDIGRKTFVSLEFGVESIYDDTLRRVNRGHDYAAVLRAMELVKGTSLHIGAHLILGFPWETREQWLSMAGEMSRLGVDMVKIHHLHVVRGTGLAAEYSRQPFRVLEYEEYLDLLCDFVERLDPKIVIERMFGEAPFGLLIAPNWNRDKNDLMRDIQRKFEERDVMQGRNYGAKGINHRGTEITERT